VSDEGEIFNVHSFVVVVVGIMVVVIDVELVLVEEEVVVARVVVVVVRGGEGEVVVVGEDVVDVVGAIDVVGG